MVHFHHTKDRKKIHITLMETSHVRNFNFYKLNPFATDVSSNPKLARFLGIRQQADDVDMLRATIIQLYPYICELFMRGESPESEEVRLVLGKLTMRDQYNESLVTTLRQNILSSDFGDDDDDIYGDDYPF